MGRWRRVWLASCCSGLSGAFQVNHGRDGRYGRHGRARTAGAKSPWGVRESPWQSVASAALAANAALALLNLCCHLLDRQIQAQADAFEREGGFTERLYRTRQARRRGEWRQ